MMEARNFFSIENLCTYFDTQYGELRAVDGVSFSLDKGETLGVVGESGSGKSVTALSILKLINKPGKIVSGEIFYEGKNLLEMSKDEIQKIRGDRIAMVFQEPLSSLNPCFPIGWQISESYRLHSNLNDAQIKQKTIKMLKKVRIPDAENRLNDYPHHFSGGMRQRVLIAIALACEPDLLIADEPTTALDVTVQADIMDLLDDLKKEMQLSILLISHNLNLVGERCGRIVVMYAGRILEIASSEILFKHPAHPYTEGLLNAIPSKKKHDKKLIPIPGEVPEMTMNIKGCVFSPRCKYAQSRCRESEPDLLEIALGHACRCHRSFEGGLGNE